MIAWKKLRRTLIYFPLNLLIRILRVLGSWMPINWFYKVAKWISTGLWYAYPLWKKVSVENLKVAFPNQPDEFYFRTARQAIFNICSTAVEFVLIPQTRESILNCVKIDPECKKILDEYRDQPVIGVSLHLGDWEYGNLALNGMGYRAVCVVNQFTDLFLDSLINQVRRSTGGDVILADGGVLRMVKSLRENRSLLLILIDQNVPPRDGGIFVPFFGLPVSVSRVPAALALRFKIPLIILVCVRTNPMEFLVVGDKISFDENDSEKEVTSKIFGAYEQMIRRYPDQYLWFYRRFRYIPLDWKEYVHFFPSYARLESTVSEIPVPKTSVPLF